MVARGLGAAGLAATLLVGLLAGCVEPFEAYHAFDAEPEYRNPGVFPGNYSFSSPSSVLVGGTYKPTDPEVVRLISDLPAYPEAAGQQNADGVVYITMAIWRPANATGPVPVIVDAGPYYEIGAHCSRAGDDPSQGCPASTLVPDTIDHPGQTTPFSLQNFLPHGYAVVQLAVRGTGTSGGCMDLMGPSEQHDLDQAITWLGTQEWSNGNVALMGVSYDGSTPWVAAAKGNPHLKTIVPISGLPDFYDLMFRNGSAETRGPIMHATDSSLTPGQDGVYWGFGFGDGWMGVERPEGIPELPTGDPVPWDMLANPFGGEANGRSEYQNMQNLVCQDALTGQAMGRVSTLSGSRAAAADPYWSERDHRAGILANYKGSVFLIHGLQDWNVDPHSAIPFNAQLRAAGLEVKEWYGQWGHANPDSNCQANVPTYVILPCRLDYAEVLLRWYDRHLKGLDVDTGPAIQVQDDLGQWRNADSFPPASPDWTTLHLGLDGLTGEAPAPATVRLEPTTQAGPGNVIELRSAPMEEDTRISGLPRLHAAFTPQGTGGALAAWVLDESPDGVVRAPAMAFHPVLSEWVPVGLPAVGHAQMNLLYHEGGEEPQPLVAGQRYVARMELEPLEVVIPKGHRILVWLGQAPYPDHQATQTPAAVDLHLGADSRLLLPVVATDPTTLFPVPGSHLPDRELLGRAYVTKPALPGAILPSTAAPLAGPDAAPPSVDDLLLARGS